MLKIYCVNKSTQTRKMLALPSNVYVIENNNKYFGCCKRTSSTVFTFTSKTDALEVRSNLIKYNMVHRQKNDTYLMKKNDHITLLSKPKKSQRSMTEIYSIDFAEFCSLVSINNVDVSIISHIEQKENGLVLCVSRETNVKLDKDIAVLLLNSLFQNS